MSTATEPAATFAPITAQHAPYFVERLETAAMYLRDAIAAIDARRTGAGKADLSLARRQFDDIASEYCTPGYPVFDAIPTALLRGALNGIQGRAKDAAIIYTNRPTSASLAKVRAAAAANLAAVEGLLVGIALATDTQAAS